MGASKYISSDSHILEPPDLWTSRLPAAYRDRAPRVVREDGTDWWTVEGYKMLPAVVGGNAGDRFEHPGELIGEGAFEKVRRGGYDPLARLKDMDLDDVRVDILYPTAGFQGYNLVRDTAFLNAMFAAYNDFVAEYCGAAPDRLKAIALVNVDDVADGVRQLARCREQGFASAMIPVKPPDDRPDSLSEYDPLWAAAQDLAIPISLHVGTHRPNPGAEIGDYTKQLPAVRSAREFQIRLSLSHLIFGGVFDRFPGLTVGAVEYESGWVPYYLEQIDYDYLQRTNIPGWPRFADEKLPSDFFRAHVFVSFQQDDIGFRLRDLIGADTLTWGWYYPHQESTFPKSHEILERLLASCSEAEKAKIVAGNAARIYRL
jgi:predicted TIM-barrel fold metal-dependent hydrolase